MSERDFTHRGGDTVFEGRIIRVAVERFAYPDGEEVTREVVHHPGAVAMLAVDEDVVWLVRQPREAVGDPDVLEVPAGRLDKEAEPPQECARRELAEEIGKEAARWRPITSFYASVGVLAETVHLFLAEGLSDVTPPDSGENERIELVPWPLDDLDGAIAATRDAKTLIALLWLKSERAGDGAR